MFIGAEAEGTAAAEAAVELTHMAKATTAPAKLFTLFLLTGYASLYDSRRH
jgi:hypothetical protein